MSKKVEYRNSVRSRRMLQTAMLKLLEQKDISEITITELVNRADLNRSTFYSHYSNPNEVLEEIENNLFGFLEKKLYERTAQAITPELVSRHIVLLFTLESPSLKNVRADSPIGRIICRVVDRYISLCLQQVSSLHKDLPFFEMHLRMAAQGTLDVVFSWLAGERYTQFTLEEISQELVRIYSKI